jgi:hydrogenase expression/formation protein HypC
MCLGIPARVLTIGAEHPDVATVDMVGTKRNVNIGLLDDDAGVREGDWILVHMGFALEVMTPEQARDAIDALGAEREAERAFVQRAERELP